jgi:hypothetical protein
LTAFSLSASIATPYPITLYLIPIMPMAERSKCGQCRGPRAGGAILLQDTTRLANQVQVDGSLPAVCPGVLSRTYKAPGRKREVSVKSRSASLDVRPGHEVDNMEWGQI